jgi:hypothetical protein
MVAEQIVKAISSSRLLLSFVEHAVRQRQRQTMRHHTGKNLVHEVKHMNQARWMTHSLIDAATIVTVIGAFGFSGTQIARLNQTLQLAITIQPSRIHVQVAVGSDQRSQSFCPDPF